MPLKRYGGSLILSPQETSPLFPPLFIVHSGDSSCGRKFTADSSGRLLPVSPSPLEMLYALVLRVFNGRTPDEIINTDLRFMKEIGLTEHLSPTRSNGLLSVIKQIRFYAIAYKAKNDVVM